MENEIKALRRLAWAYMEAARADRNQERRKLHIASNDLHMIRPVVLIDELPWNEMNIGDELTLVCGDPVLRSAEQYMRRVLYKFKHLPADMIVKPYIPVHKCIAHSDIGVKVQEETIATDAENHIISHKYEDQLAEDDSVSKFRDIVVRYDKAETMRRYQLLGDAIGDIVPIKLKGIDHVSVTTWDDISRYRSVTPLLMDLIERPEFCHKLADRLTSIMESVMQQYEALELFDDDPDTLHCTPILTEALPAANGKAGNPFTLKDVWGRGTAQIFASVSNSMHEEFDIDYMQRTIGRCGLSYYGCCEPLDKKIDIVEKLPNLRKVGVTPWADVNVAAEAIGKRFVVSSKPNPASVATAVLDKDALKKEITHILDACRRNGCAVDMVLKDISTCGGRPENIFEWEKTVMDLVQSY